MLMFVRRLLSVQETFRRGPAGTDEEAASSRVQKAPPIRLTLNQPVEIRFAQCSKDR
jgi:hypothetical protein